MDGKILVAHRNEMVLDVIQDMLQNVGFATTLTSDGHQALAKALSERYNLIIVDRNLPGAIDGVRLVERLRKYGVRVPIIGTSPEETWVACDGEIAPDVDRYLPAPFGYGDLIRTAESLLNRPLQPSITAEPDPEPEPELPALTETPTVPTQSAVAQAATPPAGVPQPTPEIRRWQPPALETHVGAARILVVDQDDEARHRTANLLTNQGYEVTAIQNGQEAFETTMLNDFELILSDLWLVDMDGFEMVDAIRKSGVSTPIAVMTSYITRDMVKELAASKVNRIFVKPTKDEVLIDFVAATAKRS